MLKIQVWRLCWKRTRSIEGSHCHFKLKSPCLSRKVKYINFLSFLILAFVQWIYRYRQKYCVQWPKYLGYFTFQFWQINIVFNNFTNKSSLVEFHLLLCFVCMQMCNYKGLCFVWQGILLYPKKLSYATPYCFSICLPSIHLGHLRI